MKKITLFLLLLTCPLAAMKPKPMRRSLSDSATWREIVDGLGARRFKLVQEINKYWDKKKRAGEIEEGVWVLFDLKLAEGGLIPVYYNPRNCNECCDGKLVPYAIAHEGEDKEGRAVFLFSFSLSIKNKNFTPKFIDKSKRIYSSPAGAISICINGQNS